MTKKTAIALGLCIALLVGVQRYGLEKQPETIAEAPMKQLKSLPASQVLPTYIASLFFGAFRALAVDILWIQLRKVEEEKRWVERREIIEMISYVQPRNPEVWSHLGWHSAYNVANGFTDPDKAWAWVKFGLLWLRRGIDALPNDPYLKDQLAFTLWQKPTWRDGEMDLPLLKRIEEDAELQAKLLPDGMKSDHPLSAFELAIPWLERAREELMDKQIVLTQMGRYLYPDSEDGFARQCMVMQGIYDWRRGRREEAKAWFRRAQKQVEDMMARTPGTPPKPGFEKKYPNSLSSIFNDWAKLYAKYPELVDLEDKARSGKVEDQRALLALLQGLLTTYGPIDEKWFWQPYNPRSFLNRLKLSLVMDPVTKICRDNQECNDSFEMATELAPGDLALANLAPEGLDVDYYVLGIGPPRDQQPPLPRPPKPLTITLQITPLASKLKATFFDQTRKSVKEEILSPRPDGKPTELKFPAAEWGYYRLKIEAEPAAPPWPPDTRYKFQYSVEQ